MDSRTYEKEFSRSLAPVFFPSNVSPFSLEVVLRNRAKTAAVVDAMKRALFYNNTDRLEQRGLHNEVSNPLELPHAEDASVIHAVLGMEGEVAEITEVLMSADLTDGEKRAKLLDEAGDFLWYLALAFSHFGVSFEEAFEKNIEKLRKRFPDKFTLEAAVNRDLDAEAQVFH